MDTHGWDVQYAIRMDRVNRSLASIALKLDSRFDFQTSEDGTDLHIVGALGTWKILGEGSSGQLLRLEIAVPTGTLTMAGHAGEPRTTEFSSATAVVEVTLSWKHAPSPNEKAQLVFKGHDDASGHHAVRPIPITLPAGQAAASDKTLKSLLLAAIAACLSDNLSKIDHVLCRVAPIGAHYDYAIVPAPDGQPYLAIGAVLPGREKPPASALKVDAAVIGGATPPAVASLSLGLIVEKFVLPELRRRMPAASFDYDPMSHAIRSAGGIVAATIDRMNFHATGVVVSVDADTLVTRMTGHFSPQRALLRKEVEARTSPFPGRTHPMGTVTGMPSAV